jgi:hypothetical protein
MFIILPAALRPRVYSVLKENSTRKWIFLGTRGRPARKAYCLGNVGSSTSQKTCRPPRPITGIALFFTLRLQLFVGPWPLFSFPIVYTVGGAARRKIVMYAEQHKHRRNTRLQSDSNPLWFIWTYISLRKIRVIGQWKVNRDRKRYVSGRCAHMVDLTG